MMTEVDAEKGTPKQQKIFIEPKLEIKTGFRLMFVVENHVFTIPEAPLCGFIEDADLKSVPFSGTTCVRVGPHAL